MIILFFFVHIGEENQEFFSREERERGLYIVCMYVRI